ncbi:uncharacterized protein METZ01_LOCUS382305, partial [marine metagenome]
VLPWANLEEHAMKAAVYHGPRDIRVEDVSRPEITQ